MHSCSYYFYFMIVIKGLGTISRNIGLVLFESMVARIIENLVAAKVIRLNVKKHFNVPSTTRDDYHSTIIAPPLYKSAFRELGSRRKRCRIISRPDQFQKSFFTIVNTLNSKWE